MNKKISPIIILILLIFGLLGVANADMQKMSDDELSNCRAVGFSEFTLQNQIATAEFNIHTDTYTEIDSMKMGYWNNGNSMGWDQNWESVDMGSSINDLNMNNFIMQAEFENLNNSDPKELKSLRIGYKDVTGEISADFQSLSRSGNSARQSVGQETYEFDHDKLILEINLDGNIDKKGIRVDFGNAQPQ